MAWCAALLAAALISSDAAVLCLIAVTVLAAWGLARAGDRLGRVLRWTVPFAGLICVINALVSEQGTTILWRFGTLPLVGYRYVTLQAVGEGAVLGLRAGVLMLVGLLYSVTVDPDAVLLLARRFSFRSSLTVSIATRLVPVLLRDSQRMSEAARTRSGPPPGRVALLQAATNGMLDRALDVAATLEVRGFGLARAGAATPRLRTRHDRAFAISAALVLATAICSRVTSPWIGAVIAPAALVPFLDRRGIG
jgi:energy-coupling factor transport system permease protein